MKEAVDKRKIFGIQGGKGSFNEQALLDYVTRHNIKIYKIKYLYNTQNVFDHLEAGLIDFGQFALHNAIGGLVSESLEAISKHTFSIVEEFGIIITHSIMILPDINFEDVKTFISHPQVFKQCKNTLATEHAYAELKSGAGELIDHAKVAEELARGTLDKNIAVLGPKILAEIYDLKIIKEDLQDKKDNLTTFLMVTK